MRFDSGADKMSSFAFMKILESTPGRYDRGIWFLSRGRIGAVYETIAGSAACEGKAILDIGCGTGNVSIACASRGASVVGIDINAGMLEIARAKATSAGLEREIQFLEIGVAEIESRYGESTFDACVSCLAFSEMSAQEQAYAISTVHSLLKPGGICVIADEVTTRGRARRLLHGLTQAPFKLLAYVLAQATTRPVNGLAPLLQDAGFTGIEVARIWGDSFMIIQAKKGTTR